MSTIKTQPKLLDPRGLRFSASLTGVVLILSLVTLILGQWQFTVSLLIAQTLIFFLTGFLSTEYSPYVLIYKKFIKKYLNKDFVPEESPPPIFAQKIGFSFTSGALLLLIVASQVGALIFIGFALFAALLNAVFGYCLGCKFYFIKRNLNLLKYTHGRTVQNNK